MLRKNIQLDYVEQEKYDRVLEKFKIKKSKDEAAIFEEVVTEFIRKYGLDHDFFETNFFQNIADQYSAISKKSVEYYNNTNKEISITRNRLLKEYGYENDDEYKEAVAFDASKEILGFPNYLNPDKSLVVIKQKFCEEVIEYINSLFFEKVVSLFTNEINKEKIGISPVKDENGKSTLECMLNDYQRIMFLFFFLRLKAYKVITFNKITYGRMTYEGLANALKDVLEARDEDLMKYTEEEEITDRWSEYNIFKRNKNIKNVMNETYIEYLNNKDAVIGYGYNYNYDYTKSIMVSYDDQKYSERINMAKILTKKYNSRNSIEKILYKGEDNKAKKLINILFMRYPELGTDKILEDIAKRDFKANKTLNYEDICTSIDDCISSIGMLLNYTYEMNGDEYNSLIEEQLADFERDQREEKHITEEDYDKYFDELITEIMGPQYVEGYVDKISEVEYKSFADAIDIGKQNINNNK